jgi:hypothetical protein
VLALGRDRMAFQAPAAANLAFGARELGIATPAD